MSFVFGGVGNLTSRCCANVGLVAARGGRDPERLGGRRQRLVEIDVSHDRHFHVARGEWLREPSLEIVQRELTRGFARWNTETRVRRTQKCRRSVECDLSKNVLILFVDAVDALKELLARFWAISRSRQVSSAQLQLGIEHNGSAASRKLEGVVLYDECDIHLLVSQGAVQVVQIMRLDPPPMNVEFANNRRPGLSAGNSSRPPPKRTSTRTLFFSR